MEISVAELAHDTDKYITLAKRHEIFITKNGKQAAKLISIDNSRIKALKELTGIISSDVDIESLRLERILK